MAADAAELSRRCDVLGAQSSFHHTEDVALGARACGTVFIAQWMGVNASQMNFVLPNLGNFREGVTLLTKDQLFNRTTA